jgi:hypothetical protein
MSVLSANEAFKETEECQVGSKKFKIPYKVDQTLSQPGSERKIERLDRKARLG